LALGFLTWAYRIATLSIAVQAGVNGARSRAVGRTQETVGVAE